MRLVAYLSSRLATLDPQSPLRPRIEGLARSHWTRNQAKLRGLVELHDALAAANISSMIFKGAVVHAEGVDTLRRRVLGDVDLLVRKNDLSAALDVMLAAGWQSVTGESPENLRATAAYRRGMNFRKGAYAEIDLHQLAFYTCRIGAKDAIWDAARRVPLLGRTVTVPSSVDS